MKAFPYHKQLDQMDCGPTCLRMVAKYYGRSYSAQYLRDKAQIGKEGVSLLGISEAAESIGFRTVGAKISFHKLATEAPLPCIVHWTQNHFVVVHEVRGYSQSSWMARVLGGRDKSGIKTTQNDSVDNTNTIEFSPNKNEAISPLSDRVLNNKGEFTNNSLNDISKLKGTVKVADPGRGLISYSAEEFCQNWLSSQNKGSTEGIVLLLEPTPLFYNKEDEESSVYGFQRVFTYLWNYKHLLFQLVLGLLVGSGLQLLFPFLTQSIVDVGINTQNLPFIYTVLGAQLMLMGGRLSVEFIRSWILLHISTRVNLNILSDFLMKLMRLPVSFFDTKQFGDIMQRVGDHNRIESFLTGQTLSVMFSVLNLIIFSVVLILYNLSIFTIFIGASTLYVGWVVLFLQQRRKLDFQRFDVSAKNQNSLIQLIYGMQEIKLAGAERPMRWAWEKLQARLFRVQMRSLSLSQYQQAGAFTINESKNILITFLSAQAVLEGQLTLGAMLAVQYIIGQLNSPIEQLVSFVQNFQDAKISLERLNEIHTLSDEESSDQYLTNELPKIGSIQIKGVSFTYPGAGNEAVLNNIGLNIPEGKTTAIVGMSGSGKTTLLKLLLKFYDPSSGEIRIGETSFEPISVFSQGSSGVNLRNISHNSWRTQCGVVMQDGYIFSDTIARNIAVGVERIDAKLLYHASTVANLQEFVSSLPLGYHTKIGSEGNGISQGQKQRILIARAVYKNPQYIFFDEATNALDATNEAVIMKNLEEFFLKKTVVVVAHRLSTVCHADQIIVLHNGFVDEIGTHSELVAKRGSYWKLVKNQLEIGI